MTRGIPKKDRGMTRGLPKKDRGMTRGLPFVKDSHLNPVRKTRG